MWSLRRSLGDTQTEPVYIATVPRRGYKFIANVQTSIGEVENDLAEPVPVSRPPPLRGIVGREAEIADISEVLTNTQARHPGRPRRGRQDDSRPWGGPGVRSTMPRRHVLRRSRDDFRPDAVRRGAGDGAGHQGQSGQQPGRGPRLSETAADAASLWTIASMCCRRATIFAGKLMADTSPSRLLATSREPLGTVAEARRAARVAALAAARSCS